MMINATKKDQECQTSQQLLDDYIKSQQIEEIAHENEEHDMDGRRRRSRMNGQPSEAMKKYKKIKFEME